MRINVTKSFLPPKEAYYSLLDRIWENNWLTNNGPLSLELEAELKKYLGLNYLLFVSNGTVAIQIAIKALKLTGEIITTPYSYCASTTSILWENCVPIYCDISPKDLNIDADKIEEKITPNTSAILATHVYGLPCNVEKIQKIADKHGLKVIYDAAHAFACKLNGKSLLGFGDVSTCSFHATKVFHTAEGGCVVAKDKEVYERLDLMRSFGHQNDDHYSIGINAKNSEFHAALGIVNLPYVKTNIALRKERCDLYDRLLNFEKLSKPESQEKNFEWNCSYYPIVPENEQITAKLIQELNKENIFPRRYFYPSLNTLPYLDQKSKSECPVSESFSNRVLSLPLYPDLGREDQERIIKIINENLG